MVLISQEMIKNYDIPAECLVAEGKDNLFMFGRCISATHEALASARITAPRCARVMPQAFLRFKK
jgi:hypothetical protein